MLSWAQIIRLEDVEQGSDQDGRVIQPDGWIHKVNLQSRTCSCRQYEENNVPCGHAMACIFALSHTLEPYLSSILLVATWIATYDTPMPAIDVSRLRPLKDRVRLENVMCNPPHTQVPWGRPKKEQIRSKDVRAPRGLELKGMQGGDEYGLQRLLWSASRLERLQNPSWSGQRSFALRSMEWGFWGWLRLAHA